MNKLENVLQKWNFKKIAVWYILLALITGVICVGTIGYFYRERLSFALHYSQIKEAADTAELHSAADKTAAASPDVVDVIVLNRENRVTYSAKKSEFAGDKLVFERLSDNRKYLSVDTHPDAVFRYVKSREFMISSIINKDFGEIRSDYDDDFFGSDISGKTVYMLTSVTAPDGGEVCVITVPTAVSGGKTAIKISAALAMLFFSVYWVLVALWLVKDAAKCKLPSLYWGLIGLFTNLVGVIVYKIYKRGMACCGGCGAAQPSEHIFCSFCGSQLGKCCEKCGWKVQPNDNFCHRCGNKIK